MAPGLYIAKTKQLSIHTSFVNQTRYGNPPELETAEKQKKEKAIKTAELHPPGISKACKADPFPIQRHLLHVINVNQHLLCFIWQPSRLPPVNARLVQEALPFVVDLVQPGSLEAL